MQYIMKFTYSLKQCSKQCEKLWRNRHNYTCTLAPQQNKSLIIFYKSKLLLPTVTYNFVSSICILLYMYINKHLCSSSSYLILSGCFECIIHTSIVQHHLVMRQTHNGISRTHYQFSLLLADRLKQIRETRQPDVEPISFSQANYLNQKNSRTRSLQIVICKFAIQFENLATAVADAIIRYSQTMLKLLHIKIQLDTAVVNNYLIGWQLLRSTSHIFQGNIHAHNIYDTVEV